MRSNPFQGLACRGHIDLAIHRRLEVFNECKTRDIDCEEKVSRCAIFAGGRLLDQTF